MPLPAGVDEDESGRRTYLRERSCSEGSQKQYVVLREWEWNLTRKKALARKV